MWWKEAYLLVLVSGAVVAAAVISGPAVPASNSLAEPIDQVSTADAPGSSALGAFENISVDPNTAAWVHRVASDRLSPRSPPPGLHPRSTSTPSVAATAIATTLVQPSMPIVPTVEALVVTVSRPAPFVAGSPGLGAGVPESVRRWDALIEKYSAEFRLDPNLVAAVMMTESGGNPTATSAKGGIGLMQVINGSADPEKSVRDGARRLASDLTRYRGDLQLTLAAYNAGVGAVDRFGGIPPYPETEFYVYIVLNRYYGYSTS